ncbi:hypothetical protein [Roseiconus lacunae]|uniref:hypothetical protein n=1 Tax=Roseiconus lacunae TaxID=2605694 RepID=UPI001E53FF32|nr:hypothetical protein [Roseiconus lacunae]MCD0462834.1 hypothetical protein [Roseiconus lacunae]
MLRITKTDEVRLTSLAPGNLPPPDDCKEQELFNTRTANEAKMMPNNIDFHERDQLLA